MAITLSLKDLASGYNTVTINENFESLETALVNCLNRNDSTNNAMNVNLDMNGYQILNANIPAGSVGLGWQGAWLTATAYTENQLVEEDGSTYICTEDHTSGVFSTDLAANKWGLVAQAGADGVGTVATIVAGTGITVDNTDPNNPIVTAINNGDVVGPASSTADSLARFDGTTGKLLKDGAVIGTDVQAYDADTTKNDTANTFTKTQTLTKGPDVASATNITLGDGNYFDITGAATIATIATKGVGTKINLHFDAALTLTHSADLDLTGINGGSDYSVTAGEELEFIEYALGDWRCTNTSLSLGGGSVELITSTTASGASTVEFSSLDTSTYSRFILMADQVDPGTGGTTCELRLGVSGVFDSGGSDYSFRRTRLGTSFSSTGANGSSIRLVSSTFGTGATEIMSIETHIMNMDDSSTYTNVYGTYAGTDDGDSSIGQIGGQRLSNKAHDSIQVFQSSGTISGVFKLYGVKGS